MSTAQSIEKAIQTIATQTAQYSSFDKTRSGVVVGYKAITNTYKIIVDGVTYTDVPIVNGLMANQRDVVKVIFPNGNVSQMFIYGTQTMYSALIGEIKPYAGNTEPTGWLICDGREVSRTEYQLLFGVIGTTYGDGDGVTTFNIPDLSGRTLIGVSDNYPLADAQGESEHTLKIEEMPSHNHGEAGAHTHQLGRNQKTVASGSSYDRPNNASATTDRGYTGTSNGAHTHKSNGGGQAHNNMPPYIVKFCWERTA